MYLMTSTRCGISAKQLERELGVTYKTAWRMFTLIRNELMTQDDDTLSGEVEMDEIYVGGKPRQADRARWRRSTKQPASALGGARSGPTDKKTPVFGMVERNRAMDRRRTLVPSIHGTDTCAHHVRRQPR